MKDLRTLPLVLLALAACGGERGADVPPASNAPAGDVAQVPAPVPPDQSAATAGADSAARDTARSSTPAADTGNRGAAAPARSQVARPPVDTGRKAPRSNRQAAASTGARQQSTPMREAESTATRRDTASKPAAATTAVKPAQKPAADTQKPAAGAPLRDQYHRAPRDTVSAVEYEGWKQFNLNCARCHGEDVSGTTIAPHLLESFKPGNAVDNKAEFDRVVHGSRVAKGMPNWTGLLDDAKLDAIFAYVKGRSEGRIGPGRPAVR
jgi:mono/diheme cytochrome c family protein